MERVFDTDESIIVPRSALERLAKANACSTIPDAAPLVRYGGSSYVVFASSHGAGPDWESSVSGVLAYLVKPCEGFRNSVPPKRFTGPLRAGKGGLLFEIVRAVAFYADAVSAPPARRIVLPRRKSRGLPIGAPRAARPNQPPPPRRV